MADRSAIEWTDASWNPLRGCKKVSPGCKHCYAEAFAERFRGTPGPYEQGFDLRLVPELLDQPLRWQRPRRIFVDSMSDLFQPGVPFDYVAAVFGVMAATPQHTFQVLTKRPGRMVEFFAWLESEAGSIGDTGGEVTSFDLCVSMAHERNIDIDPAPAPWPLPNVWLGVSVEDQRRADERIPMLLRCPAALRFLSVEPLLERVDMGAWIGRVEHCSSCGSENDATGPDECPTCGAKGSLTTTWGDGQADRYRSGKRDIDRMPDDDGPQIGWVIVGGESGPGARPCDVGWIRSVVKQARGAGVPVFVKQLGANPVHVDALADCGMLSENVNQALVRLRNRKGGDPAEWPEDLRIQEFPTIRNLAAVRGEGVADG